MAGGVHGRRGVCGGDMLDRWHAWQWGHAWQGGECVAGEMATAVDGTHPTGMHSCSNSIFIDKDL